MIPIAFLLSVIINGLTPISFIWRLKLRPSRALVILMPVWVCASQLNTKATGFRTLSFSFRTGLKLINVLLCNRKKPPSQCLTSHWRIRGHVSRQSASLEWFALLIRYELYLTGNSPTLQSSLILWVFGQRSQNYFQAAGQKAWIFLTKMVLLIHRVACSQKTALCGI